MNNFEFLQKYYLLQETIMFDKLTEFDFALIGYSEGDDSVYWNGALTNQLLNEKQIKQIEKIFSEHKRKPTVYFENKNSLNKLRDFLMTREYSKSYEDSWLFWEWEKKILDTTHFNLVRKVKNEDDLQEFLKTFDACYQKDDPQNTYGELGDYLDIAREVWGRHHKSNRLEYFTIHDGGKPVAVATLTNFKGIGYISNVGSLREVRGKGYGKAATYYCLDISEKRGNEEHCLATEEGTFANDFYKRVGFTTRFRAVAYTKKK